MRVLPEHERDAHWGLGFLLTLCKQGCIVFCRGFAFKGQLGVASGDERVVARALRAEDVVYTRAIEVDSIEVGVLKRNGRSLHT